MSEVAYQDSGEIITFYSYKGGAGRTMSLVNVACLLSRRLLPNEKVLVIDWDLEAPGLHYYLQDHIDFKYHQYDSSKQAIEEHNGLIDLFLDLQQRLSSKEIESADEKQLNKFISEFNFQNFVLKTSIDQLYFLKAGRFDSSYSIKTSEFNWLKIFESAPSLFKLISEKLAEDYRYVLIDSRTGETDTGGICTMLMPDKLVTVFTPNSQSLNGVLRVIKKAVQYRSQSDDLRPLMVFPLPSRVEESEKELKQAWRFGTSIERENANAVAGYQVQFERIFKSIYSIDNCKLDDYFDEIQIQHFPRYSYGEDIAVIREDDGDRLSLSQSYKIFADRLSLNYISPCNYQKPNKSKLFEIKESRKASDYDVFLCHNSEDKPAVIQIAQQLQTNGLKPWLDVWELQPGGIWQFELERQIESISAAAVFVGQQGLGPWQSEEIYVFLQEFIRRRCPVIPVILHDAPKQPRLPIFLKDHHWVDFRLQNPDPLVQLIWGITGKRPNSLQTAREMAETISFLSSSFLSRNESAAHEELEALRRELKALLASQSKLLASKPEIAKPSEEDNLISEKGIDYTRLRDLLKAGKWKDADYETYLRMLEAVGREEGDWIRAGELLNFPCADLKTIDRLWVKYSNGQFGFSVQKEIYVQCGAKLDGKHPGDKIWEEFCNRTGWRVNGSYISYSKVIFSTSAPKGHLPCLGGLHPSGCRLWLWLWLWSVSLLSHRDL